MGWLFDLDVDGRHRGRGGVAHAQRYRAMAAEAIRAWAVIVGIPSFRTDAVLEAVGGHPHDLFLPGNAIRRKWSPTLPPKVITQFRRALWLFHNGVEVCPNDPEGLLPIWIATAIFYNAGVVPAVPYNGEHDREFADKVETLRPFMEYIALTVVILRFGARGFDGDRRSDSPGWVNVECWFPFHWSSPELHSVLGKLGAPAAGAKAGHSPGESYRNDDADEELVRASKFGAAVRELCSSGPSAVYDKFLAATKCWRGELVRSRWPVTITVGTLGGDEFEVSMILAPTARVNVKRAFEAAAPGEYPPDTFYICIDAPDDDALPPQFADELRNGHMADVIPAHLVRWFICGGHSRLSYMVSFV